MSPERATGTTGRPRLVAGLRLIRLVGRGGEGEVWEIRDEAGRRRALKLIRPEALAAPAEVAVRSAWLERIDHPALVRVHASGILDEGGPLDGWGWAEMDFVEGADLAAAEPHDDVVQRLTPLAEALDLLHAGHWSDGVPLVHRDVKPANIVDTGSRLVLVDPSTLRGLEAGDRDVTRIGTPLFAAPEVFTGRVGPAADVYSFAVTAVALVTGARGRDLATLLADPEGLRLPWGVRAALSPDPRDRPDSCTAVLAERDLDRWLPAEGVDGSPIRMASAADRELAHRLRGPRWLLVAVLLALLAGLALLSAGRPSPSALGGAVGALAALAGIHLIVLVAAGTSFLLALTAPPVAWAVTLADRGRGPRRRRALQRAMLTGAYTFSAAGVVVEPQLGPLWAGVAALATIAVPVGVESGGTAGVLGRALLLPLWALGAIVWVAGAVVLLLPALTVARTRQLLRATGAVMASLVEVARHPA